MTVQAGIGSQGVGLVTSPCAAAGGFALDGYSCLCFFCVGRRGYKFPSRAYANEADRSRCLRAEGPPQSRLYEVSGEIEAGRTSGQAGPKPHHAGCDDEVRSAGFGKAPQQTFFRFCPQGKNLKNTQVRPHLPCLPKRADSKIAVFEIMLLSPLVFYRRIC